MEIKVKHRADQSESTVVLTEYPDEEGLGTFGIQNGSISVSSVIGSFIHFELWAEQDTYAKPKQYVIPTTAVEEVDFQINQNLTVAMVNHAFGTSVQHYELWSLCDSSVQLLLPNYDSLLSEEQLELISLQRRQCNWLLDTNPNSEYLMLLYSTESAVRNTVRFVLVFSGFTSPKYLHRIAMPANVGDYNESESRRDLHILIVGSGRNAKTVLTAQTKDPYQFFVYDLASGQTLLSIALGRHHSISTQYLFPTEVLTAEDHLLGGVNVIQIDCKKEHWTASTTFVSHPDVDEYEAMKLVQVTDTQTLWQIDNRDLIICDYLLNDFNFWLDN